MFKAHVGLLDLLIADKKDSASDSDSSILLLMKHIWLCEMFLKRKGKTTDSIVRHTTILVNALYITRP